MTSSWTMTYSAVSRNKKQYKNSDYIREYTEISLFPHL